MTFTTPPPIRIVIADGHPATRLGVATFLSTFPDMLVVGQTDHLRLVFDICASTYPHLLLLDPLTVSVSDHFIPSLKRRWPWLKVLLFSAHYALQVVEIDLHSKADGFLLKNEELHQLADAIRNVIRGEVVVNLKIVPPTQLTAPTDTSHPTLTNRECQVLLLVAQGLNNKEIAERLLISERIAKFHMSNLLHKFGLRSRTKLALIAAVRARSLKR